MKSPAPADLQRWSEEVARDSASLSFLPLARAYRRQGRRDAALRLCLRGLEQHPDNVEGHGLLAMLYFESGQRVKAYDEWSMVLTLEPDNFDALRGMGFYYLEQEDHHAAKRHLERAASQKSNDPAVQEGLRIIRERLGESTPEAPAAPMQSDPWDEPWADAPSTPAPPTSASASASASAPATPAIQSAPAPAPAPVTPAPVTPAPVVAPAPLPPAPVPMPASPPATATATATESADMSDPARIFDGLMKGGQILGAIILDQQGLVMAGALAGDMASQAESLGAILGPAIEEAGRTTGHLTLGAWKGMLIEADQAVLHLSPVRDGMIVLLAAQKTAPTGWVLRSAAQAAAIADRFLEAYA